MATLKITEVKCVKRQDSVGKDTIRIEVGGLLLSGPHKMGTNDVIALAATRYFTTDSVPITLIEVDSGTDDDLGTVSAYASQSGRGTLTGTFDRLSGAFYQIKYSVGA